MALRKLNRTAEADDLLLETWGLDRLGWWTRLLRGEPPDCDLQVKLDLAHDFARAGFFAEGVAVLQVGEIVPDDWPNQSRARCR